MAMSGNVTLRLSGTCRFDAGPMTSASELLGSSSKYSNPANKPWPLPALAQPHDLNLPRTRSKPGIDETKAAGDPLANYKNRYEAAVAAFQAAYEAASGDR